MRHVLLGDDRSTLLYRRGRWADWQRVAGSIPRHRGRGLASRRLSRGGAEQQGCPGPVRLAGK